MKREIKFRVWNNNTKRYESKGFLTSSSELDNSYVLRGIMEFEQDEDDYNDDGENIVLEQFTGLKAKNGIDIYEGDIVKEGNNISIVEWKYEASCSCCNAASGYYWSINEAKHIEVIGNIYENPELINLKPQKNK